MSKPFPFKDWHKQHLARIEGYAAQVEALYQTAIEEAVRLARTLNVDSSKVFRFGDYPQTKERFDRLLQSLSSGIQANIARGTAEGYENAALKNDAQLAHLMQTGQLSSQLASQYMGARNAEALAAFQVRKVGGLNLSQRVFKYVGQFKQELELSLDNGLASGQSASQLSQSVRQFLQQPDQLFRRVRNSRGQLVLSKAAQAYHPGRGVYRSSYKNAMRLTRTEINQAYRESDSLRYQALPFVVGIEVRRSNTPSTCSVCDALAGRYPTSFVFRGFHPHCRCYVVPILATREEMAKLTDMVLAGEDLGTFRSQNEITQPHKGWSDWVKDNKERIDKAPVKPLFITENPKTVQQATESIPVRVPAALANYEKRLGITVDKRIFSLLPEDVPLVHDSKAGKGAYYLPDQKLVNIPFDQRRKDSKWVAESVVYHEFGHAIDWARDLRKSEQVRTLMDKYRVQFSKPDKAGFKDKLYKEYDKNLMKRGQESYAKNQHDIVNQTSAAHDTLMALNANYGQGHTRAYFKLEYRPEAEFIAHAFENYFVGNPIFEAVMPKLYADTKKLVAGWVKQYTPKQ